MVRAEVIFAVMDGWVMHSGELPIPVREAMRQELLARSYLQVDETTVIVQTREKTGSHHEAYLWQFGQPGGGVVFEFAMGRGREVASRFLGNWEGKLQTDAYVGYEKIGDPGLRHYWCWSHARRYYGCAVRGGSGGETAGTDWLRAPRAPARTRPILGRRDPGQVAQAEAAGAGRRGWTR